MSQFITESDYKPYIKDANMQRMIEADTTILADAESVAIATVKDSLYIYYDVDAIFALTGDARPKQVVRWVIVLVLYYLYERLPETITPKRILNNYEQVCAWLKEIEDGKKPVDLPHKKKEDGSSDVTKFRYGSAIPPRTHNI